MLPNSDDPSSPSDAPNTDTVVVPASSAPVPPLFEVLALATSKSTGVPSLDVPLLVLALDVELLAVAGTKGLKLVPEIERFDMAHCPGGHAPEFFGAGHGPHPISLPAAACARLAPAGSQPAVT